MQESGHLTLNLAASRPEKGYQNTQVTLARASSGQPLEKTIRNSTSRWTHREATVSV